MNNPTTHCDVDRLRLLLASELPSSLERDALDHVATCPDCQAQLEALAGDHDWWREISTVFGRAKGGDARIIDESESTTLSGRHSERAVNGQSDLPLEAGDADSFVADFAVDFLQPCERSDTLGRLNEIEILEVIDRGGMGVVLKGFQRELGRYVAVKVMAPHLACSGAARQRFVREARAAAAIVHPHVMAIHSVNASGRLPYLVMPFVDCESLQRRIEREGSLELTEILRIGRQVAAGLAAAHAQGLVHRDVKPANILLECGVERAVLTDFGLARAVDDASLTRTGVIAGTPQFMSPEQARGEAIDARSDLFAFGSVLYAMCTGRPPFRAETSFGVLRRITDTEARPIREINPALPDWLAVLVERLLAKDPAERPGSATEAGRLLEACLSHALQPTVAELPAALVRRSLLGSARDRSRRRRAIGRIVAICGCAAAAVVAAIALWPPASGRDGTSGNGPETTYDFSVARAAASAEQGLPHGVRRHDQEQTLRESSTGGDSLELPAMFQADDVAPFVTDGSKPSLVWEDGIDGQIQSLRNQADEFEVRALRLWDEPASRFVESSPVTTPITEALP